MCVCVFVCVCVCVCVFYRRGGKKKRPPSKNVFFEVFSWTSRVTVFSTLLWDSTWNFTPFTLLGRKFSANMRSCAIIFSSWDTFQKWGKSFNFFEKIAINFYQRRLCGLFELKLVNNSGVRLGTKFGGLNSSHCWLASDQILFFEKSIYFFEKQPSFAILSFYCM